MAVLSHAFTIAIKEWGWIEDSPLRKVTKPREPRGRVRFLDDAERARLQQACKDSPNSYLYTIVILALSTGMRQAEIMNLKWSDIDFARERVILQETKNGEIRQVAIAGHALDLLKQLDKFRRLDTHYLFPGKFPRKPIDIRSAWETAVKKAEITNLRFHDLRHSCASYLAMNGASLMEYLTPPENYTYLLRPEELIAFTLTEGIILPRELQATLNIRQIETKEPFLTEPMKKSVMRDAVAQALWYKNPEATISEINRMYYSLRKYRGYDFINDSEKRSRDVVKKIKPSTFNIPQTIPGTIELQNGVTAFNFQKICIIVKTFAELISLTKPHLSYKEILQHPLIHCYQSFKNQTLTAMIDFCLKSLQKEIHFRDAKQEL